MGALGNNSVLRPQWDAGYPTRGDILLDYSGNDVLALVARLLLAFCLIFTYPLAFRYPPSPAHFSIAACIAPFLCILCPAPCESLW